MDFSVGGIINAAGSAITSAEHLASSMVDSIQHGAHDVEVDLEALVDGAGKLASDAAHMATNTAIGAVDGASHAALDFSAAFTKELQKVLPGAKAVGDWTMDEIQVVVSAIQSLPSALSAAVQGTEFLLASQERAEDDKQQQQVQIKRQQLVVDQERYTQLVRALRTDQAKRIEFQREAFLLPEINGKPGVQVLLMRELGMLMNERPQRLEEFGKLSGWTQTLQAPDGSVLEPAKPANGFAPGEVGAGMRSEQQQAASREQQQAAAQAAVPPKAAGPAGAQVRATGTGGLPASVQREGAGNNPPGARETFNGRSVRDTLQGRNGSGLLRPLPPAPQGRTPSGPLNAPPQRPNGAPPTQSGPLQPQARGFQQAPGRGGSGPLPATGGATPNGQPQPRLGPDGKPLPQPKPGPDGRPQPQAAMPAGQARPAAAPAHHEDESPFELQMLHEEEPVVLHEQGPDGKPRVKLGPDGKPMLKLGPDGKPVFKLKLGPDGKPLPKLGADGKPLFKLGPDGRPLPRLGPDGKPVPKLGPDGKPLFKLGPDGKPVKLGPDGKPVPQARPGQPMPKLGPDGKPLFRLGPDGKPMPLLGPDGKPRLGADGKLVFMGPDGKPMPLGPDGKPMLKLGPDGKPMLGPDGKPMFVLASDLEEPSLQLEGLLAMHRGAEPHALADVPEHLGRPEAAEQGEHLEAAEQGEHLEAAEQGGHLEAGEPTEAGRHAEAGERAEHPEAGEHAEHTEHGEHPGHGEQPHAPNGAKPGQRLMTAAPNGAKVAPGKDAAPGKAPGKPDAPAGGHALGPDGAPIPTPRLAAAPARAPQNGSRQLAAQHDAEELEPEHLQQPQARQQPGQPQRSAQPGQPQLRANPNSPAARQNAIGLTQQNPGELGAEPPAASNLGPNGLPRPNAQRANTGLPGAPGQRPAMGSQRPGAAATQELDEKNVRPEAQEATENGSKVVYSNKNVMTYEHSPFARFMPGERTPLDPREDFAATFQKFMTDPEALMKAAPEKFLFLNAEAKKFSPGQVQKLATAAGIDLNQVVTNMLVNGLASQGIIDKICETQGISPDKVAVLAKDQELLTKGASLDGIVERLALDIGVHGAATTKLLSLGEQLSKAYHGLAGKLPLTREADGLGKGNGVVSWLVSKLGGGGGDRLARLDGELAEARAQFTKLPFAVQLRTDPKLALGANWFTLAPAERKLLSTPEGVQQVIAKAAARAEDVSYIPQNLTANEKAALASRTMMDVLFDPSSEGASFRARLLGITEPGAKPGRQDAAGALKELKAKNGERIWDLLPESQRKSLTDPRVLGDLKRLLESGEAASARGVMRDGTLGSEQVKATLLRFQFREARYATDLKVALEATVKEIGTVHQQLFQHMGSPLEVALTEVNRQVQEGNTPFIQRFLAAKDEKHLSEVLGPWVSQALTPAELKLLADGDYRRHLVQNAEQLRSTGTSMAEEARQYRAQTQNIQEALQALLTPDQQFRQDFDRDPVGALKARGLWVYMPEPLQQQLASEDRKPKLAAVTQAIQAVLGQLGGTPADLKKLDNLQRSFRGVNAGNYRTLMGVLDLGVPEIQRTVRNGLTTAMAGDAEHKVGGPLSFV